MAIKLDWSGRNFTQEVAAATLSSKSSPLRMTLKIIVAWVRGAPHFWEPDFIWDSIFHLDLAASVPLFIKQSEMVF